MKTENFLLELNAVENDLENISIDIELENNPEQKLILKQTKLAMMKEKLHLWKNYYVANGGDLSNVIFLEEKRYAYQR